MLPHARTQAVPFSFVGTLARLEGLVRLLTSELTKAFRERSWDVPPWRTLQAMLSKWNPDQIVELGRLLQKSGQAPCPESSERERVPTTGPLRGDALCHAAVFPSQPMGLGSLAADPHATIRASHTWSHRSGTGFGSPFGSSAAVAGGSSKVEEGARLWPSPSSPRPEAPLSPPAYYILEPRQQQQAQQQQVSSLGPNTAAPLHAVVESDAGPPPVPGRVRMVAHDNGPDLSFSRLPSSDFKHLAVTGAHKGKSLLAAALRDREPETAPEATPLIRTMMNDYGGGRITTVKLGSRVSSTGQSDSRVYLLTSSPGSVHR